MRCSGQPHPELQPCAEGGRDPRSHSNHTKSHSRQAARPGRAPQLPNHRALTIHLCTGRSRPCALLLAFRFSAKARRTSLQVLGARGQGGPAVSARHNGQPSIPPPPGTGAVLKSLSPHGSRNPGSTLPKWKLRHTRLTHHTSRHTCLLICWVQMHPLSWHNPAAQSSGICIFTPR